MLPPHPLDYCWPPISSHAVAALQSYKHPAWLFQATLLNEGGKTGSLSEGGREKGEQGDPLLSGLLGAARVPQHELLSPGRSVVLSDAPSRRGRAVPSA